MYSLFIYYCISIPCTAPCTDELLQNIHRTSIEMYIARLSEAH